MGSQAARLAMVSSIEAGSAPLPPDATASCSDLSGEWASSVLVPNYQPLRAGLTVSKIPPPANANLKHDYYNITSKKETHWPDPPRNGWLLEVDPVNKKFTITLPSGPQGKGALQPWLNPWSNGQKLPLAPECTMIQHGIPQNAVMCKLPFCGESIRPVAAQQFNVLQLGGQHLYFGERWQSTPTGYKADDFSYLEPLRFDQNGVVQRLNFTDSFDLPLQASALQSTLIV